MANTFKIEACVQSFQEALQAQQNGADQIELCSRLDLDGLTPSVELIKQCVDELKIDIKVMIRPRGEDFSYLDEEIDLMKTQIESCKKLNVHGVVFGMLVEKSLNIDQIVELALLAFPLKVTIHKAIDDTSDIIQETRRLLKIHEHIDTILTSGGEKTAKEGAIKLKQMIEITKGKINIMPAGKITSHNLDSMHKSLNTSGYHGRKIVGDLSACDN